MSILDGLSRLSNVFSLDEARRRVSALFDPATPVSDKSSLAKIASANGISFEKRSHASGRPVLTVVDRVSGGSQPAARVDPRIEAKLSTALGRDLAADRIQEERARSAMDYSRKMASRLRLFAVDGTPPANGYADLGMTIADLVGRKGFDFTVRGGLLYVGEAVGKVSADPSETDRFVAEKTAELSAAAGKSVVLVVPERANGSILIDDGRCVEGSRIVYSEKGGSTRSASLALSELDSAFSASVSADVVRQTYAQYAESLAREGAPAARNVASISDFKRRFARVDSPSASVGTAPSERKARGYDPANVEIRFDEGHPSLVLVKGRGDRESEWMGRTERALDEVSAVIDLPDGTYPKTFDREVVGHIRVSEDGLTHLDVKGRMHNVDGAAYISRTPGGERLWAIDGKPFRAPGESFQKAREASNVREARRSAASASAPSPAPAPAPVPSEPASDENGFGGVSYSTTR